MLNEAGLWMQDLQGLMDIALEQALVFPLSVTLTASDGPTWEGTSQQRDAVPDLIAKSIGQWQPLLPVMVCISDHRHIAFHAVIVEGTPEETIRFA